MLGIERGINDDGRWLTLVSQAQGQPLRLDKPSVFEESVEVGQSSPGADTLITDMGIALMLLTHRAPMFQEITEQLNLFNGSRSKVAVATFRWMHAIAAAGIHGYKSFAQTGSRRDYRHRAMRIRLAFI